MTPEREMEIRASVALTRYDRREPGDSPGEQIRDTLAALDAEREKVARLERERDELAAKLDEREGDMHARIRAEYDRTIADTWRAANARMADERDEFAAQLAALREAWMRYDRSCAMTALHDPDARVAWDRALAATAPAVEAYTRRVQAEALESAADEVRAAYDIGDGGGAISAALEQVADRIGARAREIRGGR